MNARTRVVTWRQPTDNETVEERLARCKWNGTGVVLSTHELSDLLDRVAEAEQALKQRDEIVPPA